MASVAATIQSASGSAAPSAKGPGQSTDTGFVDALDAILHADGVATPAIAAPAQPVAKAAAATLSIDADADAPTDLANADTDADTTGTVGQTGATPSAVSSGQASATVAIPATAALPAAKAGPVLAIPNPAIQAATLSSSNATQAKADPLLPATASALLKRPTSLVFAQAGAIDPASEAEDSNPSEPVLPAAALSQQNGLTLSGPVSGTAMPIASPALAQAAAKESPLGPSGAEAASAPAEAIAFPPKAAAVGSDTGVIIAKSASKQAAALSQDPTASTSSSAPNTLLSPAPAILAAAALQATTSQSEQPAQVSTPDRVVSTVGSATPTTFLVGIAQPGQAVPVSSSPSPVQLQVAKDGAVPAAMDIDQPAAGAESQMAKPNSAQAGQAAQDDQSTDLDVSSQDIPVAPAKPDQAAAAVAPDASGFAEKTKPAGDTASVATQAKAADVSVPSSAGITVSTAPVSNTQEAGKLVLNGVTGQTPADQVSVAIHAAAVDKASSVTIALNPAELGKVEVKLDFAKDGSVQANIIAERPDTLQILRNDHQALHQALNNAGLSTDSSSLNFSLGSDRQNQQANQGNNAPYASRTIFTAETAAETPTASSTTQSAAAADGRVDMLV
jgi:hypothetical protein